MIQEKDNKIIPLPDLDKRPINKPRKQPEETEEDQEMLDFLGSILNEVTSEEDENDDQDPFFEAKDKDKRKTKIIDRPKPDPGKTIKLSEHRKKRPL